MSVKASFEECLKIGTQAMETLSGSLNDPAFVSAIEAAVELIAKPKLN